MATTTLGNKSTGSIIKLKENGTLVDFYVAKHDYESGHQAGPGGRWWSARTPMMTGCGTTAM